MIERLNRYYVKRTYMGSAFGYAIFDKCFPKQPTNEALDKYSAKRYCREHNEKWDLEMFKASHGKWDPTKPVAERY